MNSPNFPNLNAAKKAVQDEISVKDFWAYMPMHNYIFAPARAHWPAACAATIRMVSASIKMDDAGGCRRSGVARP